MSKPKFKEFKHNPRTLSTEQADALRDTLSRLGDLSGIVYNRQTDQFVGGNQRSKVMNFDDCEVEYVDQYDEPDEQGTIAVGYVLWEGQRYGYREVQWSEEIEMEANIVANKAGGDWDFAVLEEHFDTDDLLDWGFKEDELPWLTEDGEQIAPPGEDTYVAPDKIQTDIVRGDLFEFAKGDLKHRLLCGDSTDSDDVEKLMDGGKADIMVADPPYGINLSYVGVMNGSNYEKIKGDEKEFNIQDCISISGSKEQYIWGGEYLINSLDWLNGTQIIWAKRHSEEENKVFGAAFESLWVSYKCKKKLWFIRPINQSPERLGVHPTQKPIECMTRCIEMSKLTGVVYDPFLGSGTTMVAAHNLNRNCYGMELDENYCQVIVNRMLTLDKEITLLRNGEDVTDHYREKLMM